MKKTILNIYDSFCREFRIVFHDEGILLFMIFLPLVYPILYSLIYNPEVVREVKMVVVDDDRSELSREFVRKLDATQGTHIIGYAANLEEARRAINEHKAYGIMQIPEGFGRKATSGEGANAVMYAEMSLMLRYKSLLVSATEVSQEMGAEIQKKALNTLAPEAATLIPKGIFNIESVFMGNIESGFDSFVMPGVLILILQQVIVLTVGMAGGARHEHPERMGYNPVMKSPPIIADMIGQMLCYLTLYILPAIWLIYYVPLIFHFPMAGDPWQELWFILPLILSSICLGFTMQAFVWQRESIFVNWVATSIIFLFLSGLTWPRFAMPDIWQWIGDLVPATWGVEGFIRMNTNGASLAQTSHEFYWLWGLTGGYFVLACLMHLFFMRRSVRRLYIIRQGKTITSKQ